MMHSLNGERGFSIALFTSEWVREVDGGQLLGPRRVSVAIKRMRIRWRQEKEWPHARHFHVLVAL
jgi:hypothetical protein